MFTEFSHMVMLYFGYILTSCVLRGLLLQLACNYVCHCHRPPAPCTTFSLQIVQYYNLIILFVTSTTTRHRCTLLVCKRCWCTDDSFIWVSVCVPCMCSSHKVYIFWYFSQLCYEQVVTNYMPVSHILSFRSYLLHTQNAVIVLDFLVKGAELQER